MTIDSLTDIALLLYYQGKQVGVCRPDYMGMLGVHVKTKNIVLPKDSVLEIEVLGPRKKSIESCRIPVVVSASSGEGFSLRLRHFRPGLIDCWHHILNRILFYDKNKTTQNSAGAV
jgi:hypothetical protein